ncbi:MAG: CHC2 zinc finger domain-containing protein [Candidatus Pacearchaeota archaeon]
MGLVEIQHLLDGGEELVSASPWSLFTRSYHDLSVLTVAKDFSPYPLQIRRYSLQSAHLSLCPLHVEKTPSAFFRPVENTFTCYGCGQFGGAMFLLARLSKDPLAYLSTICGFDIFNGTHKRELANFIGEEERLGRISSDLARYFA